MSTPTVVFIVYSPENIMGGGDDTIIRGIYPLLEEARKQAQRLVDLDTFNEWLAFPTQFKILYDKGDHSLYGLKTLYITSGLPMSQPLSNNFEPMESVISKLDHPDLQNHPKYKEYEAEYQLYVKRHKVNFKQYL